MNRKRLVLFGLLLWFPLTAMMPEDQSDDTVDHGLYAQLLKKYVVNGKVDYQGFKNEEATLDRYLEVLEKTDTQNHYCMMLID